jgi:molybdate transport system ATP-binding protein
LLLDEPFAVLAPALLGRAPGELLARLRRMGRPVLMITHDPEDLRQFGQTRLQQYGV